MNESAGCPQWVMPVNGRTHLCGRPIVRDGLCGRHAGVKDRQARKNAVRAALQDEWRAEEAERERQQSYALNVAMMLTEVTGHHFAAEDGQVVLHPEVGKHLLDWLTAIKLRAAQGRCA